MVNRRTFLKGAGTAGIAGLAGCLGGDGGDGSDGGDTTTSGDGGDGDGGDGGDGDGGDGGDSTTQTTEEQELFGDNRITFYMSPSEPQELMEKQYAPVKKQLEEEIGVTTNLRYASNYSAVLQSLAGGSGDVAETGPFAAALGVRSDKCDIALQRFAFGSWDYSSVIVTTEDSDIESLSDLEGERVAFADRLSASGALFPLYMLKQAGLAIGDLPSDSAGADFEPQFSSHAQAFSALEAGQVAAAGVGRFITVNDDREIMDGYRYVETEDGIPRAPIVVSPELSADAKSQLTAALTGAPESMYFGADGEEGTDDDLWFSKVREASIEDYQSVIDVAVDLGIKTELLDQGGD